MMAALAALRASRHCSGVVGVQNSREEARVTTAARIEATTFIVIAPLSSSTRPWSNVMQ